METASAPGLRVASSKLSLWCGRFIEAGWLAAVIVAPLFFNIYSSRVFEPDKLTTVRSIALMMAIAWLVKWVEDRRHPAPEARVTWRTPLVLPTLILVAVYMISSLLSVAPRTSLLGSYQRLQGAYTTFSYIVIFLLMLQNLRTRAQFDRLVNLVILNSLPIAMYGMLQRAMADPLPWGGDVTARVAGNMGNAIFIAAYLIMTLFLALGKIADAVASVLTSDETRLVDVVRTAGYVLIALLNGFVVMALSGSRGPQLGMLTGLFFIVLLLAQLLRRKKLRLLLTLSWIGAGLMGGVFLVLLNMPDFKAFDGLRQMPILGRLGTALSFTEGTNAVRNLIWVGASKLVTPHDPLVFPEQPSGSFMICVGPDNKDACNAIRPLIGYGPESMYVAYNRFYPPELAHFEARNASPDRSHNETWDALVITGGAGLLAYMFLFGSFFYFGFRWIGLVRTRFEKLLFPALLLASCTISVIAFIAAVGTSALGVGVAFGAALGLLIYLIVSTLINTFDRAGTEMRSDIRLRDQVMVIALLSAVMAHFIEIHLGIAIASTRTHFWAFAAMMVVLGMGWLNDSRVQAPKVELSASAATVTSDAGATRTNEKLRTANGAKVASARQRRMAQQAASVPARRSSSGFALPPWFGTVVVSGLFLGLVLGILAFNFTTNSDRNIVPAVVFWEALTKVRGETSYGILAMFLLTWIIGSLLLVGDAHRSGTLMIREKDNFAPLATAVALCMAVSLVIVIAFGIFIAGRLVDFVAVGQNTVDTILGIAEQLGAFPAYLYLLIGVVMVFGALLMRKEEPIQPRETMTAGGLAMALIAFPIGLWTMSTSNLQPIAADIIYKQAGPWDQQGSMVLQSGTNVQGWDMAIEHYRRAIALAPNEDFYYLWLGRALLEKAKSTQNTQALRSWPDNPPFTKVIDDGPQNWNRLPNTLPSANMSQEDLLIAAEVILREARVINPLNTDHSANLARMWRQSGDIATDAQVRQQRYLNSSREYQTATTLSPNNAVLWNEWASLYLYAFNDYETAMQKLDRSVSIDSRFDQTWLLRGEVLMQQAAQLDQQRQISAQIAATIPATDTQALQDAQAAQQRAEEAYRAKLRQARIEFTNAISVNQNNQQAFNVLTYINQQLGDIASAISVTQALIELNPTDWNSYKNLALLYRDANQPDRAREAAQKALELAPQDQQASLQAFIAQLGNNAP
ncbi:MAG: tetratricopeptide repeat protein [Candidatus Roseilinea sp.]|uniref:tetratricopeptide repeat protein n=1 Tax=Candidatus Roseilinea sp. TaxID=2838777 RepID=UPI00404ACBBA